MFFPDCVNFCWIFRTAIVIFFRHCVAVGNSRTYSIGPREYLNVHKFVLSLKEIFFSSARSFFIRKMINFLSKKLCLVNEETPRSGRSSRRSRLQKMNRSRKSLSLKRLQKVDKMSRKSCSPEGLQKAIKSSPPQALVVQDIVDMAVKNGTVKFLVKWLNYPPSGNTWEPPENLQHCDGLIRKCEQKIVRKLNSLYDFEFDGVPEKILDVFRFCGAKVAKVKFVESEENKFFLFVEVKAKYPHLLLNYYHRVAFNVQN